MEKYVDTKAKNFPTIRSVMMAKPGWCIVEADYCTAEMRGLGYIAGDAKLISLLEDPDKCFGIPKPECVPEGIDPADCVVRIKFPDYIKYPENKDDFVMTYTVNGETKAKFTMDQLQDDGHGGYKSPKFDMHWGVLELARRKCREVQDKKKDRGAGKVVNFSSSYGGQAASLARKIEADTGFKPTLEEVDDMLDAIKDRQPVATLFFEEMEKTPTTTGFLRAKSGRIMHCHVLSGAAGSRVRESQVTALGRKCRNYFLQENVAASAARACKWLVDLGLNKDLKGYIAVCLYDSCVIHCPVEEREIWSKALQLYMTQANGWEYHGRVLRYPVDLELNAGWSTHADPEFHAQLHDPNWNPTPERLSYLNDWLDKTIEFYKNNPTASCQTYY